MAKVEMVRKRLNIPKDATDILEWMEEQTDASVSIRLLIRDFLDIHGCVDRVGVAFTRETALRKRKNISALESPGKSLANEDGVLSSREMDAPQMVQSVAPFKVDPIAAKTVSDDSPLSDRPAWQEAGEGTGMEGAFDMADILGTL